MNTIVTISRAFQRRETGKALARFSLAARFALIVPASLKGKSGNEVSGRDSLLRRRAGRNAGLEIRRSGYTFP
jgi:hypothetical protein